MNSPALCHAIIVAAGAGTRMGLADPKQFAPLNGKPIWIRTLKVFVDCEAVQGITVVIPAGFETQCREDLRTHAVTCAISFVCGGADRGESVRNALAALPATAQTVLIHDAVRPFVTTAQITAIAAEASRRTAAILAVRPKDTVKETNETGHITHTPAREKLLLAQTPQGFNASLLRRAYDIAAADGFVGTDDASYVERLGIRPVAVEGDYRNIKLTTQEDLLLAAAFLQSPS